MPITWLDKIDGFDLGNPQKNVNAADMNQIKTTVNSIETAASAAQANIDSHEALTNNPHGVTKTQVGLNLVDNTSDATKLAATLAMFVWGEVPLGTVDGVNPTFTIANSNPSQKAVYCDGIRTNPSNFSITGATLTITNAAVIPTNSILIDYIK